MRNFGKLKTTFNNLLIEDITNKTGDSKILYKEFLKTIKESKILRTQFNIYFNIENKNEQNEFKASEFIKENINLLNSFSKKEIIDENRKLKNILSKNNLKLIESGYDKSSLHYDISNLIFKNKNVEGIIESLSNIVEYTKNNKPNKLFEGTTPPNTFIGNLMVEKFNEKYSDLNEDEKKLLKTIFESNQEKQEEILIGLKGDCITHINQKLTETRDLDEKETLLKVKENLLDVKFNKETFNTNISKLIELKKAFND